MFSLFSLTYPQFSVGSSCQASLLRPVAFSANTTSDVLGLATTFSLGALFLTPKSLQKHSKALQPPEPSSEPKAERNPKNSQPFTLGESSVVLLVLHTHALLQQLLVVADDVTHAVAGVLGRSNVVGSRVVFVSKKRWVLQSHGPKTPWFGHLQDSERSGWSSFRQKVLFSGFFHPTDSTIFTHV